MTPRKRRKHWEKNFPKFGALESGRGAHCGWRPNQIPEFRGRRDLDRSYVLQREQQIVSCREDLQLGAGSGIRIGEIGKSLSVRCSASARRIVIRRLRAGKFSSLEYILPLALREQSAAVKQHAHFALRPRLSKNFQLFIGPLVFASKAQKLKKEGATANIG